MGERKINYHNKANLFVFLVVFFLNIRFGLRSIYFISFHKQNHIILNVLTFWLSFDRCDFMRAQLFLLLLLLTLQLVFLAIAL